MFQTISSDWFANIHADFILPSHFHASTEFLLSSLIVKPLQHAIESNRDQQRCAESHIAGSYTQGPPLTASRIPLEIIGSAAAQGGGGKVPEPLESFPGYATAITRDHCRSGSRGLVSR